MNRIYLVILCFVLFAAGCTTSDSEASDELIIDNDTITVDIETAVEADVQQDSPDIYDTTVSDTEADGDKESIVSDMDESADLTETEVTDSDTADIDIVPDENPGPEATKFPIDYSRADEGTPLTQAELDAATDEYLQLLTDIHYFDVVDERVHGWPETDPQGRYWYGTWWSGVKVNKANGHVTYLHSNDGADNNGIRTAPLMESACYAYLMWRDPNMEHLTHRMIRGFNSWALSMVKSSGDITHAMLSRAHYPISTESEYGGRSLTIDYSLNRPGIDNGATEYVHLPDNPTWGDIYIKNKRSKDDIGPMFRSIALTESCLDRMTPEAAASFAFLVDRYSEWARWVEDEAWSIATYDKSANYWIPPADQTLAHYITTGNVECPAVLALRLLGRGNPGSLDCGSGISSTEDLAGTQMNNSVKQILRSSHEAAIAHLLRRGENDKALTMLQGLAQRMDDELKAIESSSPPANVNSGDLAAMILEGAAVGIPLKSHEVRWIHARLHEAWQSFRDPSQTLNYHVFDAATPDGSYSFEPGGAGLNFIQLGVPLAACASQWRNPKSRPLFNCERLLGK